MTKVHVIGHRRRLDETLAVLHGLEAIQLIDITQESSVPLPPLAAAEDQRRELEELRYLAARLEALLALAETLPAPAPSPVDLARVRADVDAAAPMFEAWARQLDELHAEGELLPRHVESLKRLLPLVPELTELEGYDTEAVVLDARHGAVLADLNASLEELLSGNFEIIAGEVDADTIGAVLVTPRHAHSQIQGLLGRQQVNRLRLPREYEAVPFRSAITAMERRIAELPVETMAVQEAVDAAIRSRGAWVTARGQIRDRLDQLAAIPHLGGTLHTFILAGWVPTPRLAEFATAVAGIGGGEVVFEEVATGPDDEPPVLVANRPIARPFEMLVGLLSAPRYGSLDPTTLMMIFLPLFFGMMLGDIAYGLIVLVIALVARKRLRKRSPRMAQFTTIFVMSAAWATAWGVVYGEFLGDLGHRLLGLEPLWINREEALQPLLIFAVAVGIAHIGLGLLLGVGEAARRNDRRGLWSAVGTFMALIGLLLVVLVAAGRLPDGVMTPAVAIVVVGTVLMIAVEGLVGMLTGPLELMGLIGNVLSYLRIAAIGIASVYLARVANELGTLGPAWIGIIVAALFHALNLALGVFSPTIQALRLHYVEFFGKFYEGGGTPFAAFGSLERKE